MSLPKAFASFEKEFCATWAKYVQLHKDLDEYRGQEITTKNIGPINEIITTLQDVFVELHTTLNFVIQRGALCQQAITEYQKFMDDIKYSGASPELNKADEKEAQA
jgi:hypothetical protein